MCQQKYLNSTVNISTPNTRGFSLIEIMIVIAIIGILSSIAIPQYNSFIQKTRRADAQVALMMEVQSLERCRAANFTYVGCNVTSAESPEAYYDISVTTNATGYTLTADGKGKQADDGECSQLTITSQGIRNPSPTTTGCWPN